jgi:uncharacterized cupin superfamily protein
MQVTRLAQARGYEAPGHHGMLGLRLQGFDASDTQSFWVGLSHFLPGGGAEREATPVEKVYVVLGGEVTVITDDGESILRPMDSCRLAPGEARTILNRTNMPASMLVAMPYPPKA